MKKWTKQFEMPQWMAMNESTCDEFAKTHPPEFWRRRSWVKRSSRTTVDVHGVHSFALSVESRSWLS